MKYSVMCANFRMTPCHSVSSAGESPGKKNARIGMMKREVSFAENRSVDKKKIVTSHTRRGAQYSRTSLFNTASPEPRYCCRTSRRSFAGREEHTSTAHRQRWRDHGISDRDVPVPASLCRGPYRFSPLCFLRLPETPAE